MRDPSLEEARARQRRSMRAIHDVIFAGWRPDKPGGIGDTFPVDRPFVEVALRRAADELVPELEFFLSPSRDFAYAEIVMAAIRARLTNLAFDSLLAELAQVRAQALGQLEAALVDDQEASRWVHLVVWADELADDGYRDPRLNP